MTRLTHLGVGLLCLLALTGVAVGQSAAFTFTTTASEAQTGGETTVTFTYENTGDSTQTAVVNVTSIPDGWEITDRSNDGGTWSGGDRTWLFLTVSPGSSVSPSLTLSVPADASGTYTVNATGANDNAEQADTVTFEFGTETEQATESPTDDTATEVPTDGTATESPTDDTATESPTDGTATESPTDGTATATGMNGTEMGSDTDGTAETTDGGSGPGFGVVVTGVALLGAALVALRRR